MQGRAGHIAFLYENGKAPESSFSLTGSYEPDSVLTFTDTSTYTPTSWLWDFGNGVTSSLQNPTQSFDSDSFTLENTIGLTVSNEWGESYSSLTLSFTGSVSTLTDYIFLTQTTGVEVYTSEGNYSGEIFTGTAIGRFDIDDSGNYYVSEGNDVKKYDTDFNLQWTISSVGPVERIRYVNNEVYVATTKGTIDGVRQYNANTGSLINSFDGINGRDVDFFSPYIGSTSSIGVYTEQADTGIINSLPGTFSIAVHDTSLSTNNARWVDSPLSVSVLSDNDFIIGGGLGTRDGSGNIRRYSVDYSLGIVASPTWTATASGDVHDIAIDSSDNIYCSTNVSPLDKFDSSGNLLWSYGGQSHLTVDVDSNDKVVYVENGSPDKLIKLNTNGTLDWQVNISSLGRLKIIK